MPKKGKGRKNLTNRRNDYTLSKYYPKKATVATLASNKWDFEIKLLLEIESLHNVKIFNLLKAMTILNLYSPDNIASKQTVQKFHKAMRGKRRIHQQSFWEGVYPVKTKFSGSEVKVVQIQISVASVGRRPCVWLARNQGFQEFQLVRFTHCSMSTCVSYFIGDSIFF